MKKLLICLSISVWFASCSNYNCDLAIDNPTSSPIHLFVDSLEVEVPAKEVVWVEMAQGNRSIRMEDTTIEFNFNKKSYMLNPTRAQYLLVEEIYSSGSFPARGSFPNKKVTFYGLEMEGPYKVYDNLIMPVTWDYGPREKLPETVQMEEGDMYTTLIKLNDLNDLIDAAKQSK